MQIHVVQNGEILWRLAKQYGVSVNRIVEANGLEQPEKLVIGQALLIPPPYPRYAVQPGDTLGAVARQYGVRVQDIMQINNLTDPNLIYPGQRLMIPVIYHQVQAGETLWVIAERYNTAIQAIVQANRIMNPSVLYPGQYLLIPQPKKPVTEVNAFITQFGTLGGDTVRKTAADLTYVSPFGYGITAEGGINPVNDTAIVAAAQAKKTVPMMLITNFSATEAGTSLAHTVLSNTNLQDTLLTNVVNSMKSKAYQGLNIDFENVSPSDKDNYNQFLQRAVARLHPEGFFVSSSLAPKTRADQPGLLYEAHDYAAHGRILDFVVLMTYEWGYRLGPPQAISPANQIKYVLDYAVTAIPRNKIFMGFQVYARDWSLPYKTGTQAETFDMQEAIRRAIANNAVIQYDETAESPYYQYTDNQGQSHQVWFEDARSAQAKFDLVKSYNLRGVSYWVLEYPFPQNWTLLEDNFTIKKPLS